jgi:predicted glycosyltransferase
MINVCPPCLLEIKYKTFKYVLLRAKKVGHQISVSFEKFDVVQALLSFFLTLFQLTV